jgi:hypothetical protein
VILSLIKALLARSAEKGSRTIVHAALAGSRADMQGKYLNKCQVEEESDYVLSDEGAKTEDQLWVCFLLLIQLIIGGLILYLERDHRSLKTGRFTSRRNCSNFFVELVYFYELDFLVYVL